MIIKKMKTKYRKDRSVALMKETICDYTGCTGTSKTEKLNTPEQIANMLNSVFDLQNETEEYVYLLCFNTAMKLIGIFELSHGTINASICSTRDIFMKALLCNAKNIIIAHNHPSGDTTPSSEDIEVAKKIQEASLIMDISFCDSIIIGTGYCSLKEQGIF